MIVVTGASGRLGRLIVEALLERMPPEQIGASVRDPGKVAHLARRGVRVRSGDFAAPASLAQAFEGATQVLMVSSNARAHGGDTLAQHRAAIEAARAAGARRVVYTSHMAASPSSAFTPMHDHAATEALLGASGLAWTALRNGFYAESLQVYMGDAAHSGILAAPRDGKVSWTAHADLAAAAAQVLADEGCFDGPTPPLVAGPGQDFADLARELAEIAGRPVSRETIDDETLRARLVAGGMPVPVVEITLGFYRAARAGEFAADDATLARLIGRPPIAARAVLARLV